MAGAVTGRAALAAPAKLTLSLSVLGRRPDGYHDLEAEMVTVDLHDVLEVDEGSSGLRVVAEDGSRGETVSEGSDNIVHRALAASGRRAAVCVRKRIPVGGGLGGGSADAAAILRWAGVDDLAVAVRLGADVPFCLTGGRAVVGGIGERVRPLPFEPREFVLLVPPFSVDTGRVYASWDELDERRSRAAPESTASKGVEVARPRNALLDAALVVEPRLGRWGSAFSDATRRDVFLAGSGSTWWVEGTPDDVGLAGKRAIELDGEHGRLIPVATVPAGWRGPGSLWR